MRIRERFNPRAPCGARRDLHGGRSVHDRISTHAPLAGRDLELCSIWLGILYFNPRAPCGARQRGRQDHHGQGGISTHAPLAGRDRRAWT